MLICFVSYFVISYMKCENRLLTLICNFNILPFNFCMCLLIKLSIIILIIIIIVNVLLHLNLLSPNEIADLSYVIYESINLTEMLTLKDTLKLKWLKILTVIGTTSVFLPGFLMGLAWLLLYEVSFSSGLDSRYSRTTVFFFFSVLSFVV